MFFSQRFIVSGLTFRSLIHFEFVYGVRKCSKFIILHVAFQFSHHHLLKRLFASFHILASLVKNKVSIGARVYFWAFCLFPLVYISVFVPVPNCLDDCSFVSQFSHSVVSNSLQPHESQHDRPPCPSPTPRVHSDSCSLSPWCHPVISSSVVPFSSCPQSLPASESFPMSQLFAWAVLEYWSFSFSIIPSNEHPGLISFRMDWLDLLTVQGTLRSLLQHHSSKASILQCSAFFKVHTWLLEKP